MKDLKTTMDPLEYKRFTRDGLFTSHRKQTFMRAVGVEGGPFKRGFSESVVFKWMKGVLWKGIFDAT